MSKQWQCVCANGEKKGPVSSRELVVLAASGELTPKSRVRVHGKEKWHRAESVKGLMFPVHDSKKVSDGPSPNVAKPVKPSNKRLTRSQCPYCNGSVTVDTNQLDHPIHCPYCHQKFQVFGPMSWFDRQMAQTSGCAIVALIFISGTIPFILGIIGLIACRNPKARENSLTMALGGGAMVGIAALFLFFMMAMQA